MGSTILIPEGDDIVQEKKHTKGSCGSCTYSHEKSKADEFWITEFAAFIIQDDGQGKVLKPVCQIYGRSAGYGDILRKAQADQRLLPIKGHEF